MIKLGVVALVSASSQFVIGLTVAYLSHNGLLSMLSMIAAQLVTLLVLYGIFAKDKLPGIIKPLKIPLRALRGKQMGPLVIYTALTALAIMAISLVQIADLFIVQNLINVDVKFYADIYVVSRIVFFGGMIFIWPFLGEISLDHHHFNRKPFFKLMIYFTAIMLAAVIALFFFGDKLINILFGPSYDIHLVRVIAILAVLYKYFLLVITAIILYFVVLRNYAAVWLSITAASLVLIYAALINKASSLPTLLIGLTIIAALVAITAVIMLLHTPVKKSRE
jgi:O-antigen/teichoic acid export membrane protein